MYNNNYHVYKSHEKVTTYLFNAALKVSFMALCEDI